MSLIICVSSQKFPNISKNILPLHGLRVNVEIFWKILDGPPPLPARADPQRGAGDEADRPEICLSSRHSGRRGGQREENSWISEAEK